MAERFELPNKLGERSIHIKVIPTVCNLENMLTKFIQVNGDFSQLKQWEKRSYKAYKIEEIKNEILNSPEAGWKEIIRKHILAGRHSEFGASCIDIYLVAFVAETYGKGKEIFYKYVMENGITDKGKSAQAIWSVGKGDGVYLEILHDNGLVKDWGFIKSWVEGRKVKDMIVSHERDVLGICMDNDQIKNAVKKVLISPAQGWEGNVMRQFELGQGGYTPRHTHPWPHINYILEGEGFLHLDGQNYLLEAGSFAFVPSNKLHQFTNIGNGRFVLICIVPEEGDK